MTKVNRPVERIVPTARLRRWRWLLAALATIGGVMLAVTHGAEQVDSGWAIAIPAPLVNDPAAIDAQQQLLLRRLLDQTDKPLLQRTPAAATQSRSTSDKSGFRFAVRPDGVDGWRPATQFVPSQGSDMAAHAIGPHLGAPIVVNQPSNDEVEVDCNGQAPTVVEPQSSEPQAAEAGEPEQLLNVPGEPEPEESATIVSEDDAPPASNADAAVPEVSQESAAADDTTPITDGAGGTAPQETAPQTSSSTPTKQAPAANSNTTTPEPELPALTKQMLSLRTHIRAVLKGYYRKALNSRDNDPWEVMHGMLAFGVQSRIHQGGPTGNLITSVGWLCYNKPCKGQTLMYVTPTGEVRAKYGVGLQGHLGQLLAMLAQCHVSADYPIRVGTNEFTIHDLIEAEKLTCYPKSELTFKLLALQHYIDLNDKWVNDQGLEWDFPRLVSEELAQPIRGAACGGTHRLSGLSLTVKTRLRRGEPLDGEYLKAAQFVKKYQQYAYRLQNRDGSLSTSWFRGAGDDDDLKRRMKTTGHILEWLCYSLNDDELRDPRTVRAVTYLANLMYYNYDEEWEVGPMCHATHALLLYDERVFEPYDKEGTVAAYRSPTHVARRTPSDTIQR